MCSSDLWKDVGTAGGGHGQFHILFLFFVSSMFSISLMSLLGYHIHLVLNNRTTLEAFRSPVFRRGPDKEGFSLGRRANLAEVFGDEVWSLLLPVFSSFGDGLTFPQRFSDDAELGCGPGTNLRQGEASLATITDLGNDDSAAAKGDEDAQRRPRASCLDFGAHHPRGDRHR